jgi:hypothetical protein
VIFLVWMRIAPLPGCKMIPDAGADTLESVLSAGTESDVPRVLEGALQRHRYRLETLEACIAYDPNDWDDRRDPERRVRDAAELLRGKSGAVFVSLGPAPR